MAGIDGYTKLLLHCDGADESTTFTDDSRVIPAVRAVHVVTAHDGAQVDTAQKKFGTGSCLLDGTDDYLDTPVSEDWCFGNGPFTIDFQIRFPGTDSGNVCGQKVDATHYWVVNISAASEGKRNIYFTYINGSGATEKFTWAGEVTAIAAVDTWYHIELTRVSSGSFTLRIDGTAVTFTRNFTPGSNGLDQAMVYFNAPLTIGHDQGNGAGYFLDAWIDEFRISKGVARHIANFTAPAAAYSDTSETDTIRTLTNLQAMLADNITHDVPPQIVRDAVFSTRGVWTSYSPTVDGWTGSPTVVAYYYRTGNLVMVSFDVSGTSDGSDGDIATIALPFTAATNAGLGWIVAGYGIDNSVTLATPIEVGISSAGTVIACYKDFAATVWTKSGTKRVFGTITYICAD